MGYPPHFKSRTLSDNKDQGSISQRVRTRLIRSSCSSAGLGLVLSPKIKGLRLSEEEFCEIDGRRLTDSLMNHHRTTGWYTMSTISFSFLVTA